MSEETVMTEEATSDESVMMNENGPNLPPGIKTILVILVKPSWVWLTKLIRLLLQL